MINSAVISGGESDQDRQLVRDALQHNADETMRSASRDERLEMVKPLSRGLTEEGWTFTEMHCKTVDDHGWYSEFSIAGPSTLIYVTIEGATGTEASIDLARSAVMNISWEGAQRVPARKPFWKFW